MFRTLWDNVSHNSTIITNILLAITVVITILKKNEKSVFFKNRKRLHSLREWREYRLG